MSEAAVRAGDQRDWLHRNASASSAGLLTRVSEPSRTYPINVCGGPWYSNPESSTLVSMIGRLLALERFIEHAFQRTWRQKPGLTRRLGGRFG